MIADANEQFMCRAPDEAACAGLLALMSGLSQAIYAAGWMQDIEYELWSAIQPEGRIMRAVTARQRHLLRLLSEEADGWWRYEDGPVFVPMAEWERLIARRAGRA